MPDHVVENIKHNIILPCEARNNVVGRCTTIGMGMVQLKSQDSGHVLWMWEYKTSLEEWTIDLWSASGYHKRISYSCERNARVPWTKWPRKGNNSHKHIDLSCETPLTVSPKNYWALWNSYWGEFHEVLLKNKKLSLLNSGKIV